MKYKFKRAIKKYQCNGCENKIGDFSCYKVNRHGLGCEDHINGFGIIGLDFVLPSMPNGFNRLGIICPDQEQFDNLVQLGKGHLTMFIFDRLTNQFSNGKKKFTIPVWKYKSKDGHTFIRGLLPRLNMPFMYIILEDCLSKVDCLEITEADIEAMEK